MSTKIYNGYKLPAMSLSELYELCREIRCLAEATKNLLIRSHWNKEEYTDKFFEIVKKIEKSTNSLLITDSEYDFKFEVVFFPTNNGILFIPFSCQKDLTRIITDRAEYYGYWDNADRDMSVSEDSWEQRREDWEKVMGGSGWVPSKSGFSFLFTDGRAPSVKELWP